MPVPIKQTSAMSSSSTATTFENIVSHVLHIPSPSITPYPPGQLAPFSSARNLDKMDSAHPTVCRQAADSRYTEQATSHYVHISYDAFVNIQTSNDNFDLLRM